MFEDIREYTAGTTPDASYPHRREATISGRTVAEEAGGDVSAVAYKRESRRPMPFLVIWSFNVVQDPMPFLVIQCSTRSDAIKVIY